MIERFGNFLRDISEIYRYWHRIAAEVMSEYDLKGSYVVYFTTLYNYPDVITAAKLGELCTRNKADVSRAVNTFERRGIITRIRVGGNGYRALVTLTDKGNAIAENICRKACEAVAITGRDLTADERSTFYHALGLIAANLRVLDINGGI